MEEILQIIVAVGVGGCLFFIAGFLASIIVKRLDNVAEIREAEAAERPKERPAWLDTISRPFKGKMPKPLYNKAEQMIIYAGHPMDLHPEDLMGLMCLGVIMGLWLGLLVCHMMKWNFLIAIPIGLVGLGLPWLWLRDQVLTRHAQIVRDLPFNIDLLTLAVEAGLDFAAGVAKMVEKGKAGPVRDEFKIMLSEMRMGKSRADAMHDMAVRVGLPSFNSFLATLIQADRLGTGLGKVLRIQADQMRMERSQRAEKKAAEAPVKMLLPLVCFIFPTIWVILAGPLVFQWFFK